MDEWPPPEARVRASVWRAEEHLGRREYFAASQALAHVFDVAGDDELIRGLHHLAAAGFKHQGGDDAAARRQLAHARRRLADRPEAAELIALVERDLDS
jgi:hypothetical protein